MWVYSGRIPEFMATFLTAFASAFTATAPFCLGLRHTASNFVFNKFPINRFVLKEMAPCRLMTDLGQPKVKTCKIVMKSKKF